MVTRGLCQSKPLRALADCSEELSAELVVCLVDRKIQLVEAGEGRESLSNTEEAFIIYGLP